MEQENNKFFWIICFFTVIGAIFWSFMYVMQQLRPLFVTFLLINIVSLIVITICFIADIRKNKSKK